MNREPLAVRGAVIAVVSAGVQMLVAFGVPLTGEQEGALLAFVNVASILAVIVWTRGAVTPVTDPRDDYGDPLTPDSGEPLHG